MAKARWTIADILKLLKAQGPAALTPAELKAARALVRSPKRPAGGGYEAHKARTAERQKAQASACRDIAPLPEVKDPDRRELCRVDFRTFCETYLSATFYLAWSKDHLKAIDKIQRAVLEGGLFALAMPRGFGKTSLTVAGGLWALLYGHREFVALIGQDEDHAKELIEAIKIELETNDRLYEDFPEICHAVRKLEGIANRCKGQTCNGRRTYIEWTATRVSLPYIAGSRAAGAVVKVAGITGRVRGMQHKKPNGQTIRPSLAIVDDPQTDESAHSATQCRDRLAVINGAVLGLAGPGVKISAFMPCTVIAPDDVSSRVLDQAACPEWQGERTQLLPAFPTNRKMWDEYDRLRRDSLGRYGDLRLANDYYAAHRKEMDRGARASWAECYDPDELSAVQHAMNLFFRNQEAFFAEHQNDPQRPSAEMDRLRADAVCQALNGRGRATVPPTATRLTGFIDVHDKLLFWAVCAWDEAFTGYVLDYGTFPDQQQAGFTLRDAQRTLGRMFPGTGAQGAIQAGLEQLVRALLQREFRATAGVRRLDKLFVDARYGTPLIHAVKHKVGGSTFELSMGKGVTAGQKPISSYRRKPGEIYGHFWYRPNVQGTRDFPHTVIDTNYWKSRVHAMLQTAQGDPGSLTLWGKDAEAHRLFAEHVAESETWTLTMGQGREVHEWKQKPSRPDNHWLDCLVGCAAAASAAGLVMPGTIAPAERKRKRYTQKDLVRR